jgi:hypothetical protein
LAAPFVVPRGYEDRPAELGGGLPDERFYDNQGHALLERQ